MRKNSKTQSTALRLGPPVKALILCLFIGGSGLGYVWQQKQIQALSREFTRQERILGQLREINLNQRHQFAVLRSQPELERRARELNLGLVPPQQQQIITLREPVADLPRAEPPPGLALDRGARVGGP